MIEYPSAEQYYHGSLEVTCTACAGQREHPPFEGHINLGGQTALYCPTCKEVHPHFIGIKEKKKQPGEGSGRRRARS